MDRRRLLLFSAIFDGPSLVPRHRPIAVQLSVSGAYAASGIASLQKVQDKYATDYIQSGYSAWRHPHPLPCRGHRTPGTKSPPRAGNKERSAPLRHTRSTVYSPPSAGSAIVSASVRGPGVRVLNAAFEPSNSHDIGAPRFTWAGKTGTSEWVEYDFDKPQSIHSAEVFWAADAGRRLNTKLPIAWKVLYKAGEDWKEVQQATQSPIAADTFNQTSFQPVTTTGIRLQVQLASDATAGLLQWRLNGEPARIVQPVDDLQASETFEPSGDALVWTITLRNPTDHPVEIGDLSIGLPMNRHYVGDKTETYTKRVIQHGSIAGDGSYIYWMRTNAEGPYLVMVPQPGTSLEYFEELPATRIYNAYIHAAASMADLKAKGGNWRLPATHLVLAPKGQAGDSKTYSFRFRWAPDYDGVREVLYQEKLFDVAVVPGMTVPTDLDAEFSLHTRNAGLKIEAEHPQQTQITALGEHGKDIHVYKVHFSKLGENLLRVRYGEGQYLSLEFFVTEPIETLFKKRSAFIVSHEQHTDPTKWYDGLFSQWDMKNHILRSPDDLDGLQSYAVACDDTELGKSAFIAGKNIVYPDTERNLRGRGLHPQVCLGRPAGDNERENSLRGLRDSELEGQPRQPRSRHQGPGARLAHLRLSPRRADVLQHVSRRQTLPRDDKYLDSKGYLERAFGTANAFFTVPMDLIQWSPFQTGT